MGSNNVGALSYKHLAARGRRCWRLGLAALIACACNAFTGVNDIEIVDDPAASGSAGASGVANPPERTESPLQGACNALTGTGCLVSQVCRFSRAEGAALRRLRGRRRLWRLSPVRGRRVQPPV
jgi:hypothetical protein